MQIDERKERNAELSERDTERGPARHDQSAAPIGDAILAAHAEGRISYAIPAHAGNRGPTPDAAAWMGESAFRSDIGMSHQVDNRKQSWEVEPTAQELFAEAVGAEETLFSTGGSSLSVRVALMTVAGPGDTVILARNMHKSAIAGLILSGAVPVWIEPDMDDTWHIAHVVDADAVRRALAAHPEAKAVMVGAPTYYGVSADVPALAAACHEHGVPLITDDAWALDHAFCSRLPHGSLEGGADIAIGSVHKTLTGLSQTSVLSVQGDLIDRERLHLCFELQESTSASALLMSSIDAARRQFVRDGEVLLGNAIDQALALRERIAGIDGLLTMDEPYVLSRPGVAGFDPTHVLIDVSALGITGYAAADWLREERGVMLELSDHRHVMPVITFADDEHSIDRLALALADLAAAHAGRDWLSDSLVPPSSSLPTEQVMTPREAFFARTEDVAWKEAAGRISAELVTPYPPGVPAVVPGERLTDELVEYLERVVALDGMVEGAGDPSLSTLRVVVEG